MNKRTKIKIALILFAVIAVTITGLHITRRALTKNELENTLYQVKKETYENCIEIAGTVSAAQEQTLQALGDGTVLGVYVKKGDKVKKGDIIIQLDSTEQEYNLAKLDYEMASLRITGSKKELQLQEKQRLSLLRKIEDRKVTATFDGIIADLDVSVGDSLEAKDSVGTLVNIDYLTAEVEIPETEVSKLQPGQKVDFSFPAYSGDIKGYVVSWPAIGEVTSRGATIVKAKIRIDKFPDSILPNYSFTGKIQITDPIENIVVEKYAVAYENHEAYVETASGKRIDVKVQPYGKTNVKILEGLSGGEMLKAQSKPEESGFNRMRGGPGKNSPAPMDAPPPGRF
ncbi:MAG: efflux RND transporter periplasmic adaptor subunit [Treponema sp.]|nr:efflux RND transporter periplasmic adaptor subunit [Treponema sp.]